MQGIGNDIVAGLSKHRRLELWLRGRIETGHLKPGERVPAELKLAAEHQLSPGTVRRALATLIQDRLLESRRGSGVYVRAKSRQKIVGVMVPNMANPDHAALVEAVTQQAAMQGYAAPVLVRGNPDASYKRDRPVQVQFVDRMAEMEAGGIVMCPTTTDPDTEAQLRARMRELRLPCVVVNDFWTDCRLDHHICFDIDAALDMAVARLAGLGHRRLALWRPGSNDMPGLRRSFPDFLRKHGLDHGLTVECDQPEAVINQMLAGGVTAVIAFYYTRACGLAHVWRMRHCRIPEDLSVVCLAGKPAAPAPGLDFATTLAPVRQMVARALEILLEGADESVSHVFFKPQWYAGATVAPPAMVASGNQEQG